MAFKYLMTKGIGIVGHVAAKTKAEFALSQQQVQKILDEVEKSRDEFNASWLRDYAIIFMAYRLGLRVGETVLLERRHFADLFEKDIVSLPTLKNIPRIQFACPSCKKKCRLKQTRIGTEFTCRCGVNTMVPKPDKALKADIPELDLPFIEPDTIQFILEYIQKLPPQQNFLFESKSGRHISIVYACRIFYTFVDRAGLSKNFSFHSLRHGRAVRIYSQTKDLKSVMESLRHHSLEMAQVYANIDEDMKKEIKDKLAKSNKLKPIKLGAAK